MASKDEYKDAARKGASERSPREQSLVDKAYSTGMTDVKNIDHDTQRRKSIFG